MLNLVRSIVSVVARRFRSRAVLESRPVQPPTKGKMTAIPQVGGLHHRYARLAAFHHQYVRL